MMFNFGGFRKSKFGIVTFVFFASQAMASNTGEITISGEIYEASCQVTSASMAIVLDEILKSRVVAQQAFGSTSHRIEIRNCPSNVNPEFRFSANNLQQIYSSSKGILNNLETSNKAEGVYVQLRDKSGVEIDFAGFKEELEGGSNTIVISAAYYVDAVSGVTAGGVSSAINYEIHYP